MNSIGIEMVWLPLRISGSGVWISRSEVSADAFRKVLPDLAAKTAEDENGLLYRVLGTEAELFCEALTKNETRRDGKAPISPAVAPEGWHYALPTANLWNYARATADIHNLKNFDGGVSEWIGGKAQTGRHLVWGTSPGAETEAFRKGPVSVPDVRDTKVQGTATPSVKGGVLNYHPGRIGFRVILVPTPK